MALSRRNPPALAQGDPHKFRCCLRSFSSGRNIRKFARRVDCRQICTSPLASRFGTRRIRCVVQYILSRTGVYLADELAEHSTYHRAGITVALRFLPSDLVCYVVEAKPGSAGSCDSIQRRCWLDMDRKAIVSMSHYGWNMVLRSAAHRGGNPT
jgi:hypothetical protein